MKNVKTFENFDSKIMSQKAAIDFFLPQILKSGKKYKKIAIVNARIAKSKEVIETITGDGKETTNTAKKGDYVITNSTGEEYIIGSDVLKKKYDHIKDDKYQAKGECTAMKYSGKSTKFVASWDEEMVLKTGDMIVTADKREVYRIAIREFNETYKLVQKKKK